jgi:hypothetical protein
MFSNTANCRALTVRILCAMWMTNCGGMVTDTDAAVDASVGDADDASEASDVDASDAIACATIDAESCIEGKHILVCGHASCVTDEDSCFGRTSCVNVCEAGEYGEGCNNGGAAPSDNCRNVGTLLSGLTFYCCQCN